MALVIDVERFHCEADIATAHRIVDRVE